MKNREQIRQMTAEEKAAFLSGASVWKTREYKRLGIPAVFCADGPHGIRKQAGSGDHLGIGESVPSTCFPTAAAVANSWDEALGEEIGRALGREAVEQDVNILLGPGLNIKRNPLCGRNFEYFSEDPYLSGKMAASYIRGIQSQGIYACPKHFAVNSQETRRMAMNAVLDERTMREIYLTGFEIAVKEGGAKAIMSSYNEVNGTYANENPHLLQDILRKEWGFDGIVITDWGASNDHVEGVKAGSNLEMPAPGLDSARELLRAVEDGRLTVQELDSCVDDLLTAVVELAQKKREREQTGNTEVDKAAHHALAYRAAAESAVLLKNKEQILPLKPGCRVAVIGDFAAEPRYQGAGSSQVCPTMLDTVAGMIGTYDLQVVGMARGYRRDGKHDALWQNRALELAAQAEMVLFFFGLDERSESEGLDRIHMRLPGNQLALLKKLAKVNKNIVGILSAGAPVEMPWECCCRAILHGYLSGQAGAGAILDILTGKVNPSGKLAETYPIQYTDVASASYYPGEGRNSEYRESLFVGYRYFDTVGKKVKYPFGYGLSYTSFAYSDLSVTSDGVSVTVTNTGDRDGAEIVQVYVGKADSGVFRPRKELKGFAKLFLRAGESGQVRIPFDDKTFRYWNRKTDQWEQEGGRYQVMVGGGLADIRLIGTLCVKGTEAVFPYTKDEMGSYYSGNVENVKDAEFAQLLGYPVPEEKKGSERNINDAMCQMKDARSMLARGLYRLLVVLKKRADRSGTPDLTVHFIFNMPFRGIAKLTQGMVSMEMAEGFTDVVNGHFCRGMRQMISGFFRNQRENREYEKRLK